MRRDDLVAQSDARSLKRQALVRIEIRENLIFKIVPRKLRSAIERTLVMQGVVDPKPPSGRWMETLAAVNRNRKGGDVYLVRISGQQLTYGKIQQPVARIDVIKISSSCRCNPLVHRIVQALVRLAHPVVNFRFIPPQ